MKIKKFFLFTVVLSVLIIVFINIVLVSYFYITKINFSGQTLAITSGLIFILILIVLNNSVQSYIHYRIDQIYTEVKNLKKRRVSSSKVNIDEFGFLIRDILKFSDRKAKEIKKLNSRENYRRDFLGNVAHELKTPLFTVQGYLLTLIEGAAEDKEIRTKYLNRANNAIERLSEIVNDLDLITKLETNDLNLKPTTFNVITLIQKVFDLLEMQAKKRNIKLTLDKFYDIPEYVLADEAKIEQVLINLIMNSIKYGIPGGTTLVSLNYVNDEKVAIHVTDNGEGIKKEDLPRLFERFYRADKSRSREQGGSGLGLSIVKHIIEAHEQTIKVKSKEGQGSTFYFTLDKD